MSDQQIHANSIQINLNRALSMSQEFSDKPTQPSLLEAQKYMKQAINATDANTRAAALAQAKQALIAANNAMAAKGYGKVMPSISSPNNRRLL